MTKHEALAIIEASLPALDAGQAMALADVAQSMTRPRRSLSDREKHLLLQSHADFADGRTVTLEQSRARTDALFARFRAANP
jgi:hypothetical protein